MTHQTEQRYLAITLNVSSANKMFKSGLFHYLRKIKNLTFLKKKILEPRDLSFVFLESLRFYPLRYQALEQYFVKIQLLASEHSEKFETFSALLRIGRILKNNFPAFHSVCLSHGF